MNPLLLLKPLIVGALKSAALSPVEKYAKEKCKTGAKKAWDAAKKKKEEIFPSDNPQQEEEGELLQCASEKELQDKRPLGERVKDRENPEVVEEEVVKKRSKSLC